MNRLLISQHMAELLNSSCKTYICSYLFATMRIVVGASETGNKNVVVVPQVTLSPLSLLCRGFV